MATLYWKGGTSTDIGVVSNWVTTSGGSTNPANLIGLTNGTDDVIFNYATSGASSSALIDSSTTNVDTNGDGSADSTPNNWKSLTIEYHASLGKTIVLGSSGLLTVAGLEIKKSGTIFATHTSTIKFAGTPKFTTSNSGVYNLYIKLDSTDDSELNTDLDSGIFDSALSRSRVTFLFAPSTQNIPLVLENGLYPNMDFHTTSSTAILNVQALPYEDRTNVFYGVDMLNLDVDTSFKVLPLRYNFLDKSKHFKITGTLTLTTDTFNMGLSTFELVSTTTTLKFPTTGTYGVENQFTSKFTNVIIGTPVEEKNFITVEDNTSFACEHLHIKAGGRLYGPDYGSDSGSEIHCVQPVTVEGDWNFSQISDGVYRTTGTTMRLSVNDGGTGLNFVDKNSILYGNHHGALGALGIGSNGQVLSIDSGNLAWSSSAGGSAFAVSDITGATELTSGLADADELVLSDGGVLKRMDISVLKTYMQAGLTFTTNTNTQNTTTLSFVDSSNDIILRNTTGGAGSGTDDIKFVAGSNITLTHTDADNITIASTDTNTDVDVSVANLKSALNSDFGGDVIFGSQTDDNVKYKGTVSIGDIDNAGSAKLSVNGFSTMNGLILGYGSGPGYIRTYNSSDNLELYAHNGTDHIKMIELDAANDTLTLGATGDTVTINDDLVVTGDLTVSGTTTTLNTATLDVEDLNITVGKAANSSSAANGAGLTFGAWSSGTIPTLTWVHADSRLAVNKTLYSSGGFVGLLTGNVTGNVSGNAGTVTLGSDNGSVSHFLTFSDSATGSQALKTDDTLTYIPSSGRLTTNVFVGDLAGDVTGDVTGDLTGNADTVTNGVYTTGNQSIAGVKTFTSSPLLKAGLDLVNPNLAGAMGITLQNEDGKFLLYTDEGQLVIKDFLVDTGASTDGTDTFPFKLQSGAATDTFIIKTGGRVDVSGALHAGSFVGDVTGNVSGSAATATTATNANQLNATNDRDLAPEDLSYANDFQVFFTTKEGIEDGSTTNGGDYQDAIVLNTWSDASGGDANLLAFDKSSFRILHYHADQAASNWGTAKQLAYTDSDITGNAATATTVTGAAQTNITSLGTLTALEVAGNTTGNVQITIDNDHTEGLGTFALQEDGSTTGIFQYRGSNNGTLPNTVRVGSNVAGGSLAFTYAGGTTGMYIKGSDGNVGIGTTSPDYTLDVAGNIGVDNIIYHNGDGNTYLNFQDDDFRIVVGNDLAFHYDEGSASKLHLSYNGEADVEIGNAGGTPDFFFGGSQGSYNGNMGIGTTSPAAQLQIDTPDSNSAGNGIRLNRPSSGDKYHAVEFATNGTVDWGVGQNNNDAFEVYENGAASTTRFTIKEGGNVGIGTTSPASLLHVGSTAYELSSGAYLTSSHQRTAKMVIHADDANTDWDEQEIGLALHNEDPTNNNWSPHIAFTTHEDDDGDPTNANPVAVAAISATYNTRVANGWAKGDLVFFTNGGGSGNAERMRITSAGKVGIGDSTPATTLEVYDGSDANIRVRGNSNYATTLEVTNQGCKLHMGDIDSAEDSFLTFGAFNTINNLDTAARDFHLYGTNTTKGFYFDESAGRFGIGTTAPEHGILEVVAPLDPSGSDTTFTYATTLKLDVEDSDSAEGPAILFRHGATGDHNAADYYFQVNGDGGGMSAHEYANNWGYAKWFHGAGADGHKPLMKISYGGSTNSGAAMYGTLQLTSATAAWDVFDGGHTGLHPTSFTTGVYLNAGGNSYINGGNLGINTTSPASQLDISSASTATLRLSNSDTALTEDQITGEIIFYQNDDSSSADGITGRIGMRSAKRLDGTNYYGDVGDMGFFVAGSGNYTANTNAALEAMTIRAGGKVGIGTTTPSTALQVDGTVTATAFAGALTGNVTGNADTATLAATVTVGQDNTADATHYINFTDDNTGANAIKVDTGLTYNPSSNKITATRFEGALIGNADTVTNGVYTSGDQTIAGVKTLSSYMILTGDTTAAPSDLAKVHVGEDSGQLKIRTQYGTIQLGSTSSSWNHILGSQGRFYFNEPIIINGNGTYGNLSSYSTEDLILGTNSGTETRITIKQDTGNVGIGTTSPTHKLHVNGSFTATTKEFTIPHPIKKGKTLSHGSLEGPEYGVYVRGKSKDKVFYLPDYWKDLVHEDSITVQLTSIGKSENLYVVDYNTEYIEVENDVEYFYYVQAERKDVDKLEVET